MSFGSPNQIKTNSSQIKVQTFISNEVFFRYILKLSSAICVSLSSLEVTGCCILDFLSSTCVILIMITFTIFPLAFNFALFPYNFLSLDTSYVGWFIISVRCLWFCVLIFLFHFFSYLCQLVFLYPSGVWVLKFIFGSYIIFFEVLFPLNFNIAPNYLFPFMVVLSTPSPN